MRAGRRSTPSPRTPPARRPATTRAPRHWPPALAEGTPTVGAGLDAALLTTVDRTDGSQAAQVRRLAALLLRRRQGRGRHERPGPVQQVVRHRRRREAHRPVTPLTPTERPPDLAASGGRSDAPDPRPDSTAGGNDLVEASLRAGARGRARSPTSGAFDRPSTHRILRRRGTHDRARPDGSVEPTSRPTGERPPGAGGLRRADEPPGPRPARELRQSHGRACTRRAAINVRLDRVVTDTQEDAPNPGTSALGNVSRNYVGTRTEDARRRAAPLAGDGLDEATPAGGRWDGRCPATPRGATPARLWPGP